jgi:hypothetical protein
MDVGYMQNVRKYGTFLVAIFFILAMVSLVLAHDPGDLPEAEGQITNAPEFSSVFLPLTMIIGFLGAVVMIKIIRED